MTVDAGQSPQFKRIGEPGKAAAKNNDTQPMGWLRRHFGAPNVGQFDVNGNPTRDEPAAGASRFREVHQPIPFGARRFEPVEERPRRYSGPEIRQVHVYQEAENERIEYRPIGVPLAPLPNLHVGQPPHMAPGVMTYMRGWAPTSQIHHQTPLVYAEQPHYPGYVPPEPIPTGR